MPRWPWVVAAFGSAAVGITIGALWWLLGPEQAAVWAAILALLPVAFGLFGWARSRARAPSTSTPDQIDAAARMLAGQVGRQWREEAGRRGLTDPQPLAVRWKSAPPSLGDHARLAGELSGRSDRIANLADRFLRLPQRRLVVLGPPGAGKTSLAVLLTLELWRRYEEGGSVVPVVLSPGSWDPAREDMHAWIERQLNVLYPALRAADYGPTAARGLLGAGLLLPVIDGLDELTEVSREEVLRRINEGLREGGPLVVTCRTEDFRAALRDADVVTGAAVIEAEPVRLDDAETFLLGAVPPGSPAAPGWRALFADARRAPRGLLAAVFSNPLMVWLVRVIYADAGREPGELAELPDVSTIEDQLLDALVPAVFDPSRQGSWQPAAAGRWLAFLAAHLERLGTRDLAWWQLREQAPTIVRLLVFGLLGGLLVDAVVRLPEMARSYGGTVATLLFALVFGLLGVFRDLEQGPGRRPVNPLVVFPISGLGVGLAFEGPRIAAGEFILVAELAPVAGLALGAAFWLVSRVMPTRSPMTSSGPSVVVGLAVALALGFLTYLAISLEVALIMALNTLIVWLVGDLLVRFLGPRAHHPVAGARTWGRSIAGWAVLSFALWFAVAPLASIRPFLAGFAYGALAGMLSPQRPGRALLSIRGRRQAVLQAGWALLAGLPTATVVIAYGQLTRARVQGGLPALVSLIALLLLPVLAVVASTRLVQTPLTTDQATNPRETLRDDRTLTLITGPLVAVVTGPLVGALLGLPAGVLVGLYSVSGVGLRSVTGNLRFALAWGLWGGVAALAFGLGRPWLSYTVARSWLALRGRLPWRLMSFLDDAHRLGVLRQVGPLYQFRHAGLQDRLARPATPHPDRAPSS